MGDALKKVQAGQPLAIPARAYNTFVAAAQDFLDRREDQGAGSSRDVRHSGIVLVKNSSAAARERFDVLGVSGILYSPSDNLLGFKNQPVLTGAVPTVASHTARFVICQAPLAIGAIGPALASGVSPVQVDVVEEGHRYADVKDGAAGSLKSGASGAALILWKESGTGEKWAVVRLGLPSDPLGGTFAVKVTKDGGDAGSEDADCTFTYTVKDLAGNELGTAMTPKRPRFTHVEYAQPATDSPGLAYYDDQGDLQLYEAVEEIPETDVCEEE